ncbi:MFS transporter [Fervidicoccus fontis]|uniref:MFS transporter n=1 Tax=Fervidicoccus fontis TaxID=683846 RepID=A0A843AJR6_9CREN|nr:MFS transporter [Fervidicoccus fontis]
MGEVYKLSNAFSELDRAKLSWGHIKVMIVSGLGFFTDAYDLFVIGIVLMLLSGPYQTSFHLSGHEIGAVGASSLAFAMIGQLLFGKIADKYGRKKIYGIELSILIIGALLSAISWNFESLLISRIFLGIGIGGDYPVSATIMSEYANAKDRGKLVGLVFAMQGFGAITAVVASVILVSYLPAEITWRALLAIGAIPPLSVVYLRRKVPETPRYALLVSNNQEEAKKASKIIIGKEIRFNVGNNGITHLTFREFLEKYWKSLFIASFAWFLMDIAFYGTGIYSSFIVPQMISVDSIHMKILISGIPYFVGAFGYFFAAFLMDSLGRKRIQIQGFIAMAAIYLIVALSLVSNGKDVLGFYVPKYLAFLIYSLSFFFINFGPNETTFVFPTELFPTKYRSTSHGIAAATGKAGAALSTYLFPLALESIGIRGVLFILSGVSMLGAIISIWLKEPAGKSLEEITEEKVAIEVPISVLHPYSN